MQFIAFLLQLLQFYSIIFYCNLFHFTWMWTGHIFLRHISYLSNKTRTLIISFSHWTCKSLIMAMFEGWDCCHGSAENPPEKLNKKNQIIRYFIFLSKSTYVFLHFISRFLILCFFSCSHHKSFCDQINLKEKLKAGIRNWKDFLCPK